MTPTERVPPIITAGISADPVTSAAGVINTGTSSAITASVISNDPVTDIRLIASLPANLGQSVDTKA